MCGRAPCGWGRASRKLRASDVRRGSRERVCHRHETPWQQLGGTAAIRNSPGVYGSAYDAPDGQYSHRAELRRSSEETVYNSAGIAGACCAARAAGSNGQTRVAGRSFDVVKDDHTQHFFQAAQTPAPHARVVVHSARSLSAFRCGVPSLPQPRMANPSSIGTGTPAPAIRLPLDPVPTQPQERPFSQESGVRLDLPARSSTMRRWSVAEEAGMP